VSSSEGPSPDVDTIKQVLGYLNFSSGAPDSRFLANLNGLYAAACRDQAKKPASKQSRTGSAAKKSSPKSPSSSASAAKAAWRAICDLLEDRLLGWEGKESAFADVTQAKAVISLVRDRLAAAYLDFHRDLLFHQTDGLLYNTLFLGRMFEAVLGQGAPWDETDRIVAGSITALNDFVGHRPVPELESRNVEPYAHERVRPVPLYVADAGVAKGRYHDVIELTIQLIQQTDDDLLRSVHFDPAMLEELAYDPRAYDFDHPVNKRPNYHFGQWDPHRIDGQGYYRRFVLQQVTLDTLLLRVEEQNRIPRKERLYEAAAVLAGTILMASGVSGWGPGAHASTETLASLLPGIATTRDTFYERLISRTGGKHGERLLKEAAERRQPFGAARQHLNTMLAKRRAAQLEHVHLAKIFARMGYPEAAIEEANIVPAASARIVCRIDCELSAVRRQTEQGHPAEALAAVERAIDLLHRGIGCGAVIDPWSLIGFDAQFSLFPALENSVRDHRADDLCDLMEQIFALYAQTWSEAAAQDDSALAAEIAQRFEQRATWWHQFAAHEIESVGAIDALEAFEAARGVAEALNLWHKGGAAAGDIRFWSPHAEMFDSPRAYALVIAALMQRGDHVASMALLVHWLGQAERIGLERGDNSFFELSEQWVRKIRCRKRIEQADTAGEKIAGWKLLRRFLDFMEANAESYWQPPAFELGQGAGKKHGAAADPFDEEEADDDNKEELFSAAYEDMVYRDSTDDGIESEIADDGQATDDEFEREARRIIDRLMYLSCMAHLWRLAALCPERVIDQAEQASQADVAGTLSHWQTQAGINRSGLFDLLQDVAAYRIAPPRGDHQSMVDYDRSRSIREALLEHIIVAIVDSIDAERVLHARGDSLTGRHATVAAADSLPRGEQALGAAMLAAVLEGDGQSSRQLWPAVREMLSELPLLYVPLSKGGDPGKIVAARARQHFVQDLLITMPRLGMLNESCELIETARHMELDHPVGSGAVTEFDELYKVGYKSLVEQMIYTSESWHALKSKIDPRMRTGGADSAGDDRESALVGTLDQLTQSLLTTWLAHSRTLRLSVLERTHDPKVWDRVVAFIQRYGGDLFTQRFLNPGNLRTILHQGVGSWLDQMQEDPRFAGQFKLLDELDHHVSRDEAIEAMSIALEAVIENYGEYRDYNSTTTQSDHGDQLFMLLDFLRLRSQYDQFAWRLKPVVFAHDLLVRSSHNEAARMWRRAFADRVGEEADRYLKRLTKLQKRYAMRMPTIADRIGERFIRPMVIDRTCSLVKPAMLAAGDDTTPTEFEILREETELLTRQPSGVGLDVPVWLTRLEDEIEDVLRGQRQPIEHEFDTVLPRVELTYEEVQSQLLSWKPEKGYQ
jgi:hypothetical protein